jgi:hypothetical protein
MVGLTWLLGQLGLVVLDGLQSNEYGGLRKRRFFNSKKSAFT